MLTAIWQTLAVLEGEYAFVFTSPHDPDNIYAARYKSPLVFGTTDQLSIIASDQTAIALTKTMTFVKEGDVVKVSADRVRCYAMEGGQLREVEREKVHIPWVDEALDRHGHPYYMIKEIYKRRWR
ncbi:MAG: hypothetical protein R3F37_15220 [Candidatus Competibacteraceae bacterium]